MAFSKSYFSGGMLSSKRSETTNRSLKRRLSATADLRDFYNFFMMLCLTEGAKRIGKIIGLAMV